MVVLITNSYLKKGRILDWDAEGLNQVYHSYVTLKYYFITKNGYSGYIESPMYWPHVFWTVTKHYYLDQLDDVEIWFNVKWPKPYQEIEMQHDNGQYEMVWLYAEKYFHKKRFEDNTWVDLSFKHMEIESVEDSTKTKSVVFCPYSITNITPIEIESKTKTIENNDIDIV